MYCGESVSLQPKVQYEVSFLNVAVGCAGLPETQGGQASERFVSQWFKQVHIAEYFFFNLSLGNSLQYRSAAQGPVLLQLVDYFFNLTASLDKTLQSSSESSILLQFVEQCEAAKLRLSLSIFPQNQQMISGTCD